jgi:hypothetical protein
MFNCYLHGWSSRDDTCPKCIKIETVTTTGTYPDYIVGISGQELERLRSENSRLREALEILAAEDSGTCCECGDVKDIARAALEGK